MNGDPRKEEIAFAQGYFAIQTRKQELIEERIQYIERTIEQFSTRHRDERGAADCDGLSGRLKTEDDNG